TRLACSSSSLMRRASLTAQCTTMAPPKATSDHFTSGESKNVGMSSSDRISTDKGQLRRRHFRGEYGLAQVASQRHRVAIFGRNPCQKSALGRTKGRTATKKRESRAPK